MPYYLSLEGKSINCRDSALFSSKWSIRLYDELGVLKKKNLDFRFFSYSEVPFFDKAGSCLLFLATVTRHVNGLHWSRWRIRLSAFWIDIRMGGCGNSHDCLHSVKIQPVGLFGVIGRNWMIKASVSPCGGCSSLDGAGYHAVRRVRKLGRHGRYLAACRVRTRSSFRETDLKEESSSS